MHFLGESDKGILKALFAESASNPYGVDHLAFRANHSSSLEDLDRLEKEGYIRKNNQKYQISLTALAQLNDPEALKLLEDTEKLFPHLKNHYKKSQRSPEPLAKV
jgi:fructose-1,6-bisphosphatase